MKVRVQIWSAVLTLVVLVPGMAWAGNHQPALLEAALLVEGNARPQELARHLRRFDMLCALARTQVSLADPPRERAARLLGVLHREVLSGPYQPELWSVGETLDSGRYNCLTATLVYLELCRRFELPISAVSTPGHLSCRLDGPTPIYVEATCARWFDIALPPHKPEAQASGLSSSSSTNRPPHPRTLPHGRILTDDQVLAKVHYNRALALLELRHYEPAVLSLRNSRRLDPVDTAARENEVAALHNWALALAEAGQFDEAARRVSEGLALQPQSPLLRAGAKYIHAARLTGHGS